MARYFRFLAMALGLAVPAFASDLSVPSGPQAGTAVTLGTTGSGSGVLYVIGPTARLKRTLQLGDAVTLKPNDTGVAGQYTAVLQSPDGKVVKSFFVSPGPAQKLSFLAQPSRVPTGAREAISGTVFVRDKDDNLSLAPALITFAVALGTGKDVVRTVPTHNGVAWSRMDSSRLAGNAQFSATVAEASVVRVVQQVAAEPCNLRFHAQPANGGIRVQTEPVRDCAGNLVPDGMIVSFSAVDANGRSNVDAAVKKGIAQALLPTASQATLSVAAGVVSGNEVHWRGVGD